MHHGPDRKLLDGGIIVEPWAILGMDLIRPDNPVDPGTYDRDITAKGTES